MRFSRKQISKAGNRLLTSASIEEVEKCKSIINEWRSDHVYVLNKLKPFIAALLDANGIVPLFSSSRLKRMSSIQYKLDMSPEMGLGGMQDIGGLRYVLQDTETLDKAYEIIINNTPENFSIYKKDDYVNIHPKYSGYRSIHIVYQYSSGNKNYDGLRVELQIRTKLQHNWATAVETAGLVTKTSLKSSQGDNNWLLFFKIISNLMAIKEKRPVMEDFDKYSMEKLMRLCYKMDEHYKFTDTLKALRVTIKAVADNQYPEDLYLIIIHFDSKFVEWTGYSEDLRFEAIKRYEEEENVLDNQKAVVLVSVDNMKDLQNAYPSYFLDTSEFIEVLEKIKENCLINCWIE